MKRVTQKANARTKHPHENDESDGAPLLDVVRTEIRRARTLMPADPAEAASALDSIEVLVRQLEGKLTNISSFVRGIETNLGPTALAFARVDHLASDAMLGGDLSDLRMAFSHGIGEALEHVFCIRGELDDLTECVDDGGEPPRHEPPPPVHANGVA